MTTYTVTFRDNQYGTGEEIADWFATSCGMMRRLLTAGSSVVLTPDVLTALSERDTDSDGYYDGRHIWVGGEGYEVEGVFMDRNRWVNLTPHPVKVYDGDEVTMTVYSSGVSARISETVTPAEPIRSNWSNDPSPAMSTVTLGGVEGLPPTMPNTIYIVSRLLILDMMAAGINRPDCVFPYPVVRDAGGRTVGCRGFARLAR